MLSHPLETVVYVDRQGSTVRVRGDRLVVTDGDESLLRLGLRRVRQVVCLGQVGLTTPLASSAQGPPIASDAITRLRDLGGGSSIDSCPGSGQVWAAIWERNVADLAGADRGGSSHTFGW